MIDFKTMLDEKKAKWISQAGAELSTQTGSLAVFCRPFV